MRIRKIATAGIGLLCLLSGAAWAAPETPGEWIAAVQIKGPTSERAPSLESARKVLRRYFPDYPADPIDINWYLTRLFRRSWNPFDREKPYGVLVIGRIASDTEAQNLRRELEQLDYFKSVSVTLLSVEQIFAENPCNVKFQHYVFRYAQPNSMISALDLPKSCLRPGTFIGSEIVDTSGGISFSEINPFTNQDGWCRAAEDMERERLRMESACGAGMTVTLEREHLTAWLVRDYLGLSLN